MSLNYKKSLLKKLQTISECTVDELFDRLDNVPSKELVALLSSSVQLQFALEQDIENFKAKLEESDSDVLLEKKYESLGVNRSKIVNILSNLS